MKKAILLILLLSLSLGMLYAQEGTPTSGATLKGRVTDETGSPVEIANIWVARQMKGTTTNLKGEYSISVASADTVEITFSMIGYQTRRRILYRPTGVITLDVMLPHANYEDSCMVCRRIIGAFSRRYPHSPAKLRFSVQPLEPNL